MTTRDLFLGENNVHDRATIAVSLVLVGIQALDPHLLNEWAKLGISLVALVWIVLRFWVWIWKVWRRRHDVGDISNE